MSTNYYWSDFADYSEDPRVHIGLRTQSSFIWAMPAGPLLRLATLAPNEPLARNEYGDVLTGKQFLAAVSGLEHDERSVGSRFC